MAPALVVRPRRWMTVSSLRCALCETGENIIQAQLLTRNREQLEGQVADFADQAMQRGLVRDRPAQDGLVISGRQHRQTVKPFRPLVAELAFDPDLILCTTQQHAQLSRREIGHHAALAHEHNPIADRACNIRLARGQQHGFAPFMCQVRDPLLYGACRWLVERQRRLVEHDDRRVGEQRARRATFRCIVLE